MDSLNLLGIIVIPLNCVVLLIAFILNTLLLTVLCKLKTAQRSYFCLIKSLTLAELLWSLLKLCVYLLTFLGFSYDMFTRNILVLEYDVFSTIILHLIFLVMEHYVAIIKPLHYQKWCCYRYIVCRLVIIWTLSVVLAVIHNMLNTTTSRKILIVYPVLVFLCFLVMTVVYVYIYCEVRRQQRLELSENCNARTNKRALITTILILGSFLVLWIPNAVIVSLLILAPVGFFSSPLWYFLLFPSQLMVNFSYICDTLFYSIRLTGVRKLWRRSFCCLCSKRSLQRKVKRNRVRFTGSVPGNRMVLRTAETTV